jgi:hypothetical protein
VALVICAECSKQVSDRASACPNCGAPIVAAVAPAPAAAQSAVQTKGGHGRVTAIIVAGLVLVALLMMRRGTSDPLAVVLPTPRFTVANAGGSDECTSLGEYCMRTRCAVANEGNAAGVAKVEAHLSSNGQTVATRTSMASLSPGQIDTVSMDFPEAEMGTDYRYSCSLSPQ